jgi:hypothetical protein
LQSLEFVACFPPDETILTKLGAVLVPGFQGPLTLCKQLLMFCTYRRLDGDLVAHFSLPSLTLVHVVRQQYKSRVLGIL